MNELSLFTGAGGGVLGSILLGHRIIGYVENNEYRQRIIAQRIKDGIFDEAPIFSNIQAFNRAGFAAQYQGMVDVITAGFPCQPHSNAGKQLREKDPRDMWSETATTISIIKPNAIMLENVSGISKYLPMVIRDLRRIGYTVKRPAIIAAASLGAGHLRRRVWLYAYIDEKGFTNTQGKPTTKKKINERGPSRVENSAEIPSDINEMRELQQERRFGNEREWVGDCSWWETEPDLVRVVYGIPNGMDRIAALGDAQIPIVAATAFMILREIVG